MLVANIMTQESAMSRQSIRPKESDLNRALRAFIRQGIPPRIVYHIDSTIIEPADTPTSNGEANANELDAELRRHAEKHGEI